MASRLFPAKSNRPNLGEVGRSGIYLETIPIPRLP